MGCMPTLTPTCLVVLWVRVALGRISKEDAKHGPRRIDTKPCDMIEHIQCLVSLCNLRAVASAPHSRPGHVSTRAWTGDSSDAKRPKAAPQNATISRMYYHERSMFWALQGIYQLFWAVRPFYGRKPPMIWRVLARRHALRLTTLGS